MEKEKEIMKTLANKLSNMDTPHNEKKTLIESFEYLNWQENKDTLITFFEKIKDAFTGNVLNNEDYPNENSFYRLLQIVMMSLNEKNDSESSEFIPMNTWEKDFFDLRQGKRKREVEKSSEVIVPLLHNGEGKRAKLKFELLKNGSGAIYPSPSSLFIVSQDVRQSFDKAIGLLKYYKERLDHKKLEQQKFDICWSISLIDQSDNIPVLEGNSIGVGVFVGLWLLFSHKKWGKIAASTALIEEKNENILLCKDCITHFDDVKPYNQVILYPIGSFKEKIANFKKDEKILFICAENQEELKETREYYKDSKIQFEPVTNTDNLIFAIEKNNKPYQEIRDKVLEDAKFRVELVGEFPPESETTYHPLFQPLSLLRELTEEEKKEKQKENKERGFGESHHSNPETGWDEAPRDGKKIFEGKQTKIVTFEEMLAEMGIINSKKVKRKRRFANEP